MNKQDPTLVHARALQADILHAPDVWLPRREVLLEWLRAFLLRAEAPTYALGATDAADLSALEQFLRKRKVPGRVTEPATPSVA